MRPSHLSALKKSMQTLRTSDGRKIEVWELEVPSDDSFLSSDLLHDCYAN